MKILMNGKMRDLLSENAETPQKCITPLPSELLSELNDGFEEILGCVLPHDPSVTTTFHMEEGDDETGVECQVSKVNFRDYVDKGDSFERMLRLGIAYVFALKDKLEQSNLPGPFRLILGADPEGEFPSVTVRYHRLRPGQEWLGSDLEAYSDAIFAADIE